MRVEDLFLFFVSLLIIVAAVLVVGLLLPPSQQYVAPPNIATYTFTVPAPQQAVQPAQPSCPLTDYYKDLYERCRLSASDYSTGRVVYSYDRNYRDTGSYDLTVIVKDDDNRRLEDAYVRVENSDSTSKHTDEDGEARFLNLEDDCYDVAVSKSGYDAEKDRICLRDDESITIRLSHD